jgi:hypothetical protein
MEADEEEASYEIVLPEETYVERGHLKHHHSLLYIFANVTLINMHRKSCGSLGCVSH